MAEYKRTPLNYDGSKLTSHHVSSLLQQVLTSIGDNFVSRPDLILSSWPGIVGPQIAANTVATSFIDGIIHVKVKTLHSIVCSQHTRKQDFWPYLEAVIPP